MFVLILPKNYTILESEPKPTNVKGFHERLALWWALKGNDIGRTKLECTIDEFRGDLEQEVMRIRRDSYNRTVSLPTVDVDITRILFLAADPSNEVRLRLGKEFQEIQEEIKHGKLRDKFRLELPQLSVSPVGFSQALLDTQPQIVHFSGHGASTGALCFENELGQTHLVQPAALAALFKQFASQVDCVLLNACYSEIQAKAIGEHIKYVIGMNQAIGDVAAIAFAIGFYQALGAGRTIEQAYKLGKVQIMLGNIPEHLTPVLIRKE